MRQAYTFYDKNNKTKDNILDELNIDNCEKLNEEIKNIEFVTEFDGLNKLKIFDFGIFFFNKINDYLKFNFNSLSDMVFFIYDYVKNEVYFVDADTNIVNKDILSPNILIINPAFKSKQFSIEKYLLTFLKFNRYSVKDYMNVFKKEVDIFNKYNVNVNQKLNVLMRNNKINVYKAAIKHIITNIKNVLHLSSVVNIEDDRVLSNFSQIFLILDKNNYINIDSNNFENYSILARESNFVKSNTQLPFLLMDNNKLMIDTKSNFFNLQNKQAVIKSRNDDFVFRAKVVEYKKNELYFDDSEIKNIQLNGNVVVYSENKGFLILKVLGYKNGKILVDKDVSEALPIKNSYAIFYPEEESKAVKVKVVKTANKFSREIYVDKEIHESILNKYIYIDNKIIGRVSVVDNTKKRILLSEVLKEEIEKDSELYTKEVSYTKEITIKSPLDATKYGLYKNQTIIDNKGNIRTVVAFDQFNVYFSDAVNFPAITQNNNKPSSFLYTPNIIITFKDNVKENVTSSRKLKIKENINLRELIGNELIFGKIKRTIVHADSNYIYLDKSIDSFVLHKKTIVGKGEVR